MREQRDRWTIEQGHDPSSIQRVRHGLTVQGYTFLCFFSHQVQTAVGYEGTPDDIASIVSYLVSREAHFITGEFRHPAMWTSCIRAY